MKRGVLKIIRKYEDRSIIQSKEQKEKNEKYEQNFEACRTPKMLPTYA